MLRFNPRTITDTDNRTYKVKLEYFNGQTWITDKTLLGKKASQCHCISLRIPVSQATEYNFVTYDGRRSTLNQKSRIMMKTPDSILLEFDCN